MVDNWGKYLRAKEPGVREKAYAWKTAIGLQKVDGLTPSDYLIKTAQRNIEGKITLAESRDLIEGYYKSRPVKTKTEKGKKEADIVAQHITEILSEPTFSLSPASFIAIHRKLFQGVFSHAGKIRDYNITKSEWVLDEDTVRYESADVIAATLEYEFDRIPRGVHPTPVYLERFFSNLLLGTSHELLNRYLHISLAAPESELVPSAGEQVREQAGEQARADAIRQIAEKPSKFVQKLLRTMKGEMTVLEMMAALKLVGQRNFLERYLTPAIDAGLVEMTQPDSPRSPTQRYRLTAKGRKTQGSVK